MLPFTADSSATTAASEEDETAVVPPQYRRQSSSGRSKLKLTFVEGGGPFTRSASLGQFPIGSSAVDDSVTRAIAAIRKAWTLRLRARTTPSRAQAATHIIRAWRSKISEKDNNVRSLVQALTEVRQVAAIMIQRVWRGHRTRQFVYEEVCVSKVAYWEPDMVERNEADLEKCDVKVIGGFSIPAWQREIPLYYCRMRKMFVTNINVPDGTYPCKFIVDGKYKPCQYLYPTVLGRDGIENSAVALIAHPKKAWWSSRLRKPTTAEDGDGGEIGAI